MHLIKSCCDTDAILLDVHKNYAESVYQLNKINKYNEMDYRWCDEFVSEQADGRNDTIDCER
jgi:hypothetical protein